MSLKGAIFPELARIGEAMASAKRLELIDFLCQREFSVEELADATGISIASTSHHLQILKGSRLVEVRSERTRRLYSLRPGVPQLWKVLASVGNENLAEIRSAMVEFLSDPESFVEVEARQLQKRLGRGEILVIDVRPEKEFEAGHFPGAISVPMERLDGMLRELPRDREVIAYCRGPYCVLSHTAVRVLRKHGLRARRWPSGVADWQCQGFMLERGPAAKNPFSRRDTPKRRRR